MRTKAMETDIETLLDFPAIDAEEESHLLQMASIENQLRQEQSNNNDEASRCMDLLMQTNVRMRLPGETALSPATAASSSAATTLASLSTTPLSDLSVYQPNHTKSLIPIDNRHPFGGRTERPLFQTSIVPRMQAMWDELYAIERRARYKQLFHTRQPMPPPETTIQSLPSELRPAGLSVQPELGFSSIRVVVLIAPSGSPPTSPVPSIPAPVTAPVETEDDNEVVEQEERVSVTGRRWFWWEQSQSRWADMGFTGWDYDMWEEGWERQEVWVPAYRLEEETALGWLEY